MYFFSYIEGIGHTLHGYFLKGISKFAENAQCVGDARRLLEGMNVVQKKEGS